METVDVTLRSHHLCEYKEWMINPNLDHVTCIFILHFLSIITVDICEGMRLGFGGLSLFSF